MVVHCDDLKGGRLEVNPDPGPNPNPNPDPYQPIP
jgi:hypothetical protein